MQRIEPNDATLSHRPVSLKNIQPAKCTGRAGDLGPVTTGIILEIWVKNEIFVRNNSVLVDKAFSKHYTFN